MKKRLRDRAPQRLGHIRQHYRRRNAYWFSALKHAWRTTLRIDRSKITAGVALRCALGFVLPLAIGVGTGHVAIGVALAGGSASVAVVGMTYPYRARVRTLLLACLGIAVSAFVSSATSHIGWLAVLVVGLWGMAAGLLVAAGPAAMVIGLQSMLALIVLSNFTLDPLHAALQAGLLFAGALFQTLLAILPLPGQRTAPEQIALTSVYQKLADYALASGNEQVQDSLRDALTRAHTTLGDAHSHSYRATVFLRLLEEAEYIRLSLLVLAHLQENLKVGTEVEKRSAAYLQQVQRLSADELRSIAQQLQPYARIRALVRSKSGIKNSLQALRRSSSPENEKNLQQMLTYGDTLYTQLHAASRLAKSWRKRRPLESQSNLPEQQHLRINDARDILRANLMLRSTALRHALRLGFTLALATALYRIFLIPVQRGYWIPMTALLVLRPEFTGTFARGLSRLLGTMLGAVLTTLLIATLAPTSGLLVFVDALVAYLAFVVLFANYALFSAFITMEVVLLLSFVTPTPLVTAAYRAVDTAIGGVLALGVYALWPTWEHGRVPSNIASRLDAQRSYFAAIMEGYSDPDTYNALMLHSRRLESRLARSNAAASLERAEHEPNLRRGEIDQARNLLNVEDGLTRSFLALEAYLRDNPTRHALPAISAFARTVDAAMTLLATAIREGQPVAEFPARHAELESLKQLRKTGKLLRPASEDDLRIVLTEALRIVHNLTTMQQLLTHKEGPVAARD